MTRAAPLAAVLLVALAACTDRGPKAPLYSCVQCDSTRFTVVFRDSVSDPASLTDTLAKKYAFAAESRWSGNTSQKGFTAKLDEAALNGVRRNPRVAYVQRGEPIRTP